MKSRLNENCFFCKKSMSFFSRLLSKRENFIVSVCLTCRQDFVSAEIMTLEIINFCLKKNGILDLIKDLKFKNKDEDDILEEVFNMIETFQKKNNMLLDRHLVDAILAFIHEI